MSTVPVTTTNVMNLRMVQDSATMIATIALSLVVVIILMVTILGVVVIYFRRRSVI